MKHLYAITLFGIIAGISLHAADEAEQIMHAIENHNRERVRELINPENINIKLPYFKYSPLMYAIRWNDDIALDLIELGANIHSKDCSLATPLHVAATFNKPVVAQKLLEAGALTTEKTENGVIPLSIAKGFNHTKIIKLLESYDALPDIKEPEYK